MQSKTLSNTNRDSILNAIRKDAFAKWDDTPNGKRIVELRDELENEIADKQLKDVPAADRLVFDKYDKCRCTEYSVEVTRSNSGKLKEGHPRWGEACQQLRLAVFVFENSSPYGQRRYNPMAESKLIIDFLYTRHKDMLEEWFELSELRECEVDKFVAAWKSRLYSVNTSGQLIEKFPEVEPFLPNSVKNYSKTNHTTPAKLAEADATIASFGG